jgi:membrane protease YdiL (CAAX protease family)
MGLVARRWRSLPLGIVSGLLVGLGLSFLAAMQPDPSGQHHYFEIMLPGAILGVIVGFATQRFGREARR